MAHVTVPTLFQGVAPPIALQPGQIILAGELASIPHVSRADSLVGFNGTKFEDLNKSPVFGRGRLMIGLPWQLGLELAYTPPLEVGGAQPDGIYGLAIERPLLVRGRWRFGARAFAQAGHVEGDITCPQLVVDFGVDDMQNNPFGCAEPSDDDAELDHYGAEFSAAFALNNAVAVTAAFAVARLEPGVRVDALLSDGPDLSVLSTRGTVRTSALGVDYQANDRWRLAASVNYTPLNVKRPPQRLSRSDDSLNVRVLLSYRLR